jgi:AP-1-like factor
LNENENLRDLLVRLRNENVSLKQSSFTFTAPKIPIKSPDTAELPKFVSTSSAHSVASSLVTSELPSPKTTNPLDWSSLSTFDPAILNLLDDSVSQPTATEGAMQLDFGFGRNTGLASNTPYTTIASNPKFMSFASTFDSPSNSSAPASNSFVSGPFNFDMTSMSSWSPPPATSQDAQLDDLFSGYLSTMNSSDFSMQSQSSVSESPVSHHIATPFTSGTSSSLPSAAQASRSSPDSSSSVLDKHPCRSKMLKELISLGEPSPFATGIPETTTTIPCGEDATFPKTTKSEKNIEVLTAWKNITSDPKFKDVDIGSLCSEFTSKARCDGTRVVLEPQEVHSILETLSNKH